MAILHPLSGAAFARGQVPLVVKVDAGACAASGGVTGAEATGDFGGGGRAGGLACEVEVTLDGTLVESWDPAVFCTEEGSCYLAGFLPSVAHAMRRGGRGGDESNGSSGMREAAGHAANDAANEGGNEATHQAGNGGTNKNEAANKAGNEATHKDLNGGQAAHKTPAPASSASPTP